MWHLEKATSKPLERYCDLLLGLVQKRINARRTDARYGEWCAYLLPEISPSKYDTSKLKAILISEPKKLFDLNHQMVNDLLPLYPRGNATTYDEPQLLEYIAEKRKDTKNADAAIVAKYEQLFGFLEKVIDYSIVKGNRAYEIAMMKQVNTCTYCNRQYTITVGVSKGENGEKTSKVKPQFDHWFPHEHYPLLGLSFYNLIPSCSVCNSAVKGSTHFTLETHVNPYTTPNSEPDFKFRPVLKYDAEMGRVRWGVKIKRAEGSKEDNTIKDLFLEEVYDKHGELEVKDIMDFATENNPTYLKTLFNHVCAKLKKEYTQAEVYRMLFGVEPDVEKSLRRPFSKLKRDILETEGIKV